MPPQADRAVRRTWRESLVVRQIVGQQAARRGRQSPTPAELAPEGVELVVGRKVADEEQVRRLLEGDLLREVDGGVLAVVVEALVATHVSDLRVGDDDLGESGWHGDEAPWVRAGRGGCP